MKLPKIKLGQKGIAEWIILAIIAAAIPATLYLAQTTQIFQPKAADSHGWSPTAAFAPPTPTGSNLIVGVPFTLHASATIGSTFLYPLDNMYIVSLQQGSNPALQSSWSPIAQQTCNGATTCDINLTVTPNPSTLGQTWTFAVVVDTRPSTGTHVNCSGNPSYMTPSNSTIGWFGCGQGSNVTYTIVPPQSQQPQCPNPAGCYAPIAGCAPSQGCGQPTQQPQPTQAPVPTSSAGTSLFYCNSATQQCVSTPVSGGCPPGKQCTSDGIQCAFNCNASVTPTVTPVPTTAQVPQPSAFTLNPPTVSCDGTTPKVVLNWTQSANATSYLAGRKIGNNQNFEVTTSQLPASVTSFIDEGFGLQSNTGYTYQVLASNSTGSTITTGQTIQTPNCNPTATNTPTPTITPTLVPGAPSNTPTPTPTPTMTPSPTATLAPNAPTNTPSPTGFPACLYPPGTGQFHYGDADHNGIVDRRDFNLWRNQYNQERVAGAAPKWSSADFNCDGHVDTADFNLWRNGFISAGVN